MSLGRNVWHWLTEPAATLSETERQAARLFTNFILLYILSGVLVQLLIITVRQPSDAAGRWVALLFSQGLNLISYLLARTPLYRWGIGSLVVTFLLFIYATAWMGLTPDLVHLLIYTFIPLLLSATFFSLSTTLVLALVNLTFIAVIPLLNNQVVWRDIVPQAFTPLAFGSLVLVLANYQRIRLEQMNNQLLQTEARHAHGQREAAARQVEQRTRQLQELNQQLLQVIAEHSASEARLQTLVNAIPDQVATISREGMLLELHAPPNYNLFMPREQQLGRPLTQILPPAAAAQAQQAVQRALATRKVQTEDFTFEINGQLYYREARFNALNDHEVVATVRDVQQRRLMEAQLRESAQRFRAIFNSTFQFMALLDPAGRLLEINQTALDFVGVTREAVLSRFYWETPWWHLSPTAPAQLQASIVRVAQGESEQYQTEMTGRDRTITIDFSLRPIMDEQGVVTGLVAEGHDITATLQAQTELRAAYERLEHLSRSLVWAQEEERRQVARELHDQIGQSLTALTLHCRTALKKAEADPLFLHRAMRRGLEITGLISEEVRELSRGLRPPMLDDLGLFQTVRWYLDQQAQHAGFTAYVENQLTGRLPSEWEVTCFRLMQEALTNIVRHAQAQTVTVRLLKQDHTFVFEIHDDGVGFDVPQALARVQDGQSVGLLNMQERARLLGGRLDILSAPSEGATLRATFPIVR